MSLLIIGSLALKSWLPDYRDPGDVDMFVSHPNYLEDPRGILDCFYHPRIAEWLEGRLQGKYCDMATLDELLTIKVSHSYWELKNGSWSKHMADILKLQEAGATVIGELHDMLYGVWEELHGKKRVDLTMEADDFFDDAVKRVYVHDSIHRSVAYYDEPLYERCLKDDRSVLMDMKKVWDLPLADQLKLFREEIYVTALERLIIPADYSYSAGAAYAWALRRTITSLTKGRSARFIVENFGEFKHADCDYVARHKSNAHKLEKI